MFVDKSNFKFVETLGRTVTNIPLRWTILWPIWPLAFPVVRPLGGKKQVFLLLYPMAEGRTCRPERASSQNVCVTLP